MSSGYKRKYGRKQNIMGRAGYYAVKTNLENRELRWCGHVERLIVRLGKRVTAGDYKEDEEGDLLYIQAEGAY
jgi:hypothetical protein